MSKVREYTLEAGRPDTITLEKFRIAKEYGVPKETIAEKINEAFSDNFGDVILEESDMGELKVIDDYFEEIGKWLKETMK